MSSRKFNRVLHLKVHGSKTFGLILLVMHLTALLCVIAVIANTHSVLFLLIPIIIFNFYYYFKKYCILTDVSSVIGISQSTSGDWLLQFPDQSEVAVVLCDDSYLHPALVILNFKLLQSHRRISLPLFVDSLADDEHRQLRCRLRLSKPADKEKIFRR